MAISRTRRCMQEWFLKRSSISFRLRNMIISCILMPFLITFAWYLYQYVAYARINKNLEPVECTSLGWNIQKQSATLSIYCECYEDCTVGECQQVCSTCYLPYLNGLILFNYGAYTTLMMVYVSNPNGDYYVYSNLLADKLSAMYPTNSTTGCYYDPYYNQILLLAYNTQKYLTIAVSTGVVAGLLILFHCIYEALICARIIRMPQDDAAN